VLARWRPELKGTVGGSISSQGFSIALLGMQERVHELTKVSPSPGLTHAHTHVNKVSPRRVCAHTHLHSHMHSYSHAHSTSTRAGHTDGCRSVLSALFAVIDLKLRWLCRPSAGGRVTRCRSHARLSCRVVELCADNRVAASFLGSFSPSLRPFHFRVTSPSGELPHS
jgi:hypothetical protein